MKPSEQSREMMDEFIRSYPGMLKYMLTREFLTRELADGKFLEELRETHDLNPQLTIKYLCEKIAVEVSSYGERCDVEVVYLTWLTDVLLNYKSCFK